MSPRVLSLFVAFSLTAQLQAGIYYSYSGGGWFKTDTNPPARWVPNVVAPGPGDTAVLTNGLVFNGSSNTTYSIGALNLAPGGSVTFSTGMLQLTDPGSIWSGGSISYSGPLGSGPIHLLGTLSLTGTNLITVGGAPAGPDNAAFVNQGTIHQSSSQGWALNGVMRNEVGALFDIQNDSGMGETFGGGEFNNLGFFRKSGGSGQSYFNDTFDSTGGTLEAQTGSIYFARAVNLTNGTFNVSAGAALKFTNGGNVSGVLNGSGAGTVEISGGMFYVPDVCTLNFAGGLFKLSGGTIGNFSGILTNLGTINVVGTNPIAPWVETTIFENAGQIVQSTTNGFGIYGTFDNLPGALYDIKTDTGPGGTVNNYGIVRKSGGTGLSRGSYLYLTGGMLDVQTGSFSVGSHLDVTNGTINVVAGSKVIVYYGNWTELLTGTGAGVIEYSNGIVTVTPNCTLNMAPNLFQWLGGYFQYGTMTNLGMITINGTNDGVNALMPILGPSGTLVNYGQIIQTNTQGLHIDGDIGAGIVNAAGALYEIQNNSGLSWYYGSPAPMLVNNGTFRKTGGTGNCDISLACTNSGTIEVRTGAIRFTSYYSDAGGTLLLNGGNMTMSLALNLLTGTLTGCGSLTNNNNVTNSSIVSPGLPTGTLQIAGNYTQTAAGRLNIDLAGRTTNQFDHLKVTRTATLSGTLNVSLIGSFEPLIGDSFQILSCTNRVGTFSATNGVPSWMSIEYRTNGVFLNVTNTVPYVQNPGFNSGQFKLWVAGPTAPKCYVDATTNFVSWTTVATNTPFTGGWSFADPQSASLGRRFYRFRLGN